MRTFDDQCKETGVIFPGGGLALTQISRVDFEEIQRDALPAPSPTCTTIEVEEAIDAMKRGKEAILASILVEAELRARIEQQRALIDVALGYIQSGRPDQAALVLDGEKELK